MFVVDVVSSIGSDAIVRLEDACAIMGWSERDQKIFRRYLGYESIVLHPNRFLPDLLRGTVQKLMEQWPAFAGNVDLVVYCHSLHSTFPIESNLSDLLFPIVDCKPTCVSLTHCACASGLVGIEVVSNQILGKNEESNAIVLTGEKCFHPMLRYIKNNGIFGEAATATLCTNTRRKGAIEYLNCDNFVLPLQWSQIDEKSLSERNYIDHNFVDHLVSSIKSVCRKHSLVPSDIGALLPYHMSPPTANRVADSLEVERELVVSTNLTTTGHCFCGDAFLNLESCMEDGSASLRSPYIVAIAAGVTGNYTSCLFKWIH